MKMLVLGNPIAGRGKAPLWIDAMVSRLAQAGHEIDVFLTRKSGDAKARAAAVTPEDGFDRLIIAGGDGTLNEVVNGLRNPSATPIAQLPMGTANILARELGLPRDPLGTADMLCNGNIRRLDVGLLGTRLFLAVTSVGFDAMVVEAIHAGRSGTLGMAAYIKPILKTLRHYRPPPLTIIIDEHTQVEGKFAVVSNIRNYGGLFSITDRAAADSGHLDICIMRRGHIPALLSYTASALCKRMSRRGDIAYLTGQSVRIEAPRPFPVEVDGEFGGLTPCDITLRPGLLPVVVPAR